MCICMVFVSCVVWKISDSAGNIQIHAYVKGELLNQTKKQVLLVLFKASSVFTYLL